MSKFNFGYLSDDEVELIALNKERYSKEEALELGRLELDVEAEVELEIFESCVQFGFFQSEDGEKYNCWFIKNMYESVAPKNKNQVPVWVVKVKEEQ
jgi:hypothetical protein